MKYNFNEKNPNLKTNIKLIIYFVAIIFVVLFDQITKWLAVVCLKPISDFPIIEGVIHFTYVENTGAAFGMLSNSRWVFMIASVIEIVGILIILIAYRKKIPFIVGLCLSGILGGGIGNMIDRIINGYVVDFINFELINFAVFNVADSFITVCPIIIVIYVIFKEIINGKNKA